MKEMRGYGTDHGFFARTLCLEVGVSRGKMETLVLSLKRGSRGTIRNHSHLVVQKSRIYGGRLSRHVHGLL